jgi:hypothetical protein
MPELVSNGHPDSDLWWTGVLAPSVEVPANLTRGISIIVNPLIRLPWTFPQDGGDVMPSWCRDPMALNRARPGLADAGWRVFLSRESRFDFWARWVRDAILYGIGLFSYVPDSQGQPTQGSLIRHHPLNLYAPADEALTDWALMWRGQQYAVDDEGRITGTGRQLHFIRGHEGGLFGIHSAQLALANAVNDYGVNMFAGGVPTGVLATEQPLTQDQADQARATWQERQRERSVAVLGNGVRYQQEALSPVDAELVSMARLTNTQVAHMLELAAYQLDGDSGDSNTYANIVDRRSDFIDGTLAAWSARVEESISALLPWGHQMLIDFTKYRMPTTQEAPNAAAPA